MALEKISLLVSFMRRECQCSLRFWHCLSQWVSRSVIVLKIKKTIVFFCSDQHFFYIEQPCIF